MAKSTRRRPPADPEVARQVGNGDPELEAGGVGISVGLDGRAFFVPAALQRATPRQQRLMASIQDRVSANVAIMAQLDELVDQARSAGMSWNSIGWLVGISGEGARKRWGDDE